MFVTDDLVFVLPDPTADSSAKGSFEQSVLVLSTAQTNQLATPDFLSKILAAARLDLQRDALWLEITAGQAIKLSDWLRTKHPRHVLVFGLTPAQLGLSLKMVPYQPFEFYGAQWVFVDALDHLEPDKNRKGRLWEVLKSWFLPLPEKS